MGSRSCYLWVVVCRPESVVQGVYIFEVGVYIVVSCLGKGCEGCSYACRRRFKGAIAIAYIPNESSGASSVSP